MLRRFLFLVFLVAFLVPASAEAQAPFDDSDDTVVIKVNNPVTVAADESLDVLIVINDDATIDGTITESLVVMSGTATINGRVDGDLVVVSGDLILGPNAVVDDVHLYRSSVVRDPAATVRGDLTEEAEFQFSWWGGALVSIGIWVGLTIVVLVAGLLFALLGGRQLLSLGVTARTQVPTSILTAVVLFGGMPILAFLIFFTVIGIPLGLAILLVLIPLLWLLGYIVCGAMLGTWIRARMGSTNALGGIVLATLIGLLVLQCVSLIPFIGGFVLFLAGTYGAGALVLHLIRQRGGTASGSEASAPLTSN